MSVKYRLQKRGMKDEILPYEVVRVEGEEEDIIFSEARFARRDDAEAFLRQLQTEHADDVQG